MRIGRVFESERAKPRPMVAALGCYDPPPAAQGTPGPNRASSIANSAQAVTRARNETISIIV